METSKNLKESELSNGKSETNGEEYIRHKCSKCEKDFSHKKYLWLHIDDKHPEVRNPQTLHCHLCEATFTIKPKLRSHMEKFHMIGNKKYQCNYCNFKTLTSHVLMEHERTHTDERPEVCKWCGKGFKARKTLKTHERLHTGEKPFKCNFCESSFVQRTSLNNHLQSHHKQEMLDSPDGDHFSQITQTPGAKPKYPREQPMNSMMGKTYYTGEKKRSCTEVRSEKTLKIFKGPIQSKEKNTGEEDFQKQLQFQDHLNMVDASCVAKTTINHQIEDIQNINTELQETYHITVKDEPIKEECFDTDQNEFLMTVKQNEFLMTVKQQIKIEPGEIVETENNEIDYVPDTGATSETPFNESDDMAISVLADTLTTKNTFKIISDHLEGKSEESVRKRYLGNPNPNQSVHDGPFLVFKIYLYSNFKNYHYTRKINDFVAILTKSHMALLKCKHDSEASCVPGIICLQMLYKEDSEFGLDMGFFLHSISPEEVTNFNLNLSNLASIFRKCRISFHQCASASLDENGWSFHGGNATPTSKQKCDICSRGFHFGRSELQQKCIQCNKYVHNRCIQVLYEENAFKCNECCSENTPVDEVSPSENKATNQSQAPEFQKSKATIPLKPQDSHKDIIENSSQYVGSNNLITNVKQEDTKKYDWIPFNDKEYKVIVSLNMFLKSNCIADAAKIISHHLVGRSEDSIREVLPNLETKFTPENVIPISITLQHENTSSNFLLLVFHGDLLLLKCKEQCRDHSVFYKPYHTKSIFMRIKPDSSFGIDDHIYEQYLWMSLSKLREHLPRMLPNSLKAFHRLWDRCNIRFHKHSKSYVINPAFNNLVEQAPLRFVKTEDEYQ